MKTELPSYDDLYAFIKAEYKNSRFEGRNSDPYWGPEHSSRIVRDYMAELEQRGVAMISRHESQRNQSLTFDCYLSFLDLDATPVEYPTECANISHVLG